MTLTKLEKKSDHRIPLVKPINIINNKSARKTRTIKNRPITPFGIKKMQSWLMEETWENVFQAENTHDKAKFFQDTLFKKYEEIFPQKTKKINSDDSPWITQKIKKLDRQRKRIYRKQRKSETWKKLEKLFKLEVKMAKKNFYKNMIADLAQKNLSRWYSSLMSTSYSSKVGKYWA